MLKTFFDWLKCVAGWQKASPPLWFRVTVSLLALIYISGMAVLFLLHISANATSPFLTLLSIFTPFLFLPVLVFLGMGVWLRSKFIMLSMLALLCGFVWRYNLIYLPRFRARITPQKTLTVMTHNLGLDRTSPENFLTIIAYEQPDLIALQELTPATAEILQAKLDDYPHCVFSAEQISTALFSRYPIVEHERLYYSEGPRYLHAQISWDGQLFHVFAIHPQPAGLRWFRNTQIPVGVDDADAQRRVLETLERMSAQTGPRLMLGDFNMSEYTPAYAKLAESFLDAHREAGYGFGFTFPHGLRLERFPVPGPFVRLDYIFYSAELDAQQSRVQCGTGSDHCYVVADFILED